MSTEKTESTPKPIASVDWFKNGVIILMTLVGVFAASITFLQSYAGLQSEDLVQRSEFTAVNSTGLSFQAGLEAAQGIDTQELYSDYLQRAVRADTKARALRMGGQGALAAGYALDAERWNKAAEEVVLSDPLLAEYNQDAALYRETLLRQAYVEGERQYILLTQSRAWSNEANRYVAILSTLSISLFLAGLSLTISSRVRYFLAAAATGLAFVCTIWTVLVLLTPIPEVPEEAIQRFVDGLTKYNVSQARDEDPIEAIADFDAAIEKAEDYGRAYFYRSLANTDSRLAEIHLDPGKAIADGERALELGIETSPVYGNLGWLYYLNGQYNSALDATEKALSMTPGECYLTFNHGLILTALQRDPSEVEQAYTRAIECARNQSDYLRNYYLDVGVVDLEDLALARPDLSPAIEPARRRLKETLASLNFFGDTQPRPTSAQFGPLTFGESIDSSNLVIAPAGEFPQTATTVYADFEFSGMTPDTQWLERWLLDGQEYFVLEHQGWGEDESGVGWIGVTQAGGVPSGRYHADVFVEGNLATWGEFTVLAGSLPRLYSHTSTDVSVTINYPWNWKITDLADYEVSVVAAREPGKPTFFGVTAWLTTAGTDDDVFNLFQYNFDAMQLEFGDFSSEEPLAFTIAERDGWLNYYTYTNADGIPIQGALAGVLVPEKQNVFILLIESDSAEWDVNVDLFDVMLSRIEIIE